MHRWRLLTNCLLAASATSVVRADVLNGTDFVIKSAGTPALSSTNYIGTYIVVPAGGATVSFGLNATEGASGTGTPHLNLVVADTKFSFNVNSTSATNYAGSTFLPGGSYVVRAERDYAAPADASTRTATINSLSVTGAIVNNINNGTTALAAADNYIDKFRKESATVAMRGPGNIPLLAGTPVNVDLKRIAFNFGNAVPGISTSGTNGYMAVGTLGVGTTTQQIQYQAKLTQNFNSIVAENASKWSSIEGTRDVQNMTPTDTILKFAQQNHMTARMHNVIWGNTGQTPSFVNTMLGSPSSPDASPPTGSGSFNTNKVGLWGSTDGSGIPNSEVAERIKYLMTDSNSLIGGQRASQFGDIDVYNESYHTGENQAGSFWPTYTDANGPTGIAQIYKAVKDAGPNTTAYVNDYNVFEDGGEKFADWYKTHIEKLRNSGYVNGLGNVVGGIGTQYYPDNTTPSLADPSGLADGIHSPARMMMTLQNLSTQGLPITLTEFGVKPPNGTGAGGASMSFNATTQQNAANMLSDAMRMMFGNANSTGFMMWGFQAEGTGNGTFGTNLYQSESALYTVVNSGTLAWQAGSWTIQPAGKVWQTQLGIQNWGVTGSDGATLNPWTTHLVGVTVDANGNLTFSGFFGDYNIGNASAYSNLGLVKGTTGYTLNLATPPSWFFWKTTNSGSWSNAANWTSGIAGAAGDTAYFGSSAAPRLVTVDGARTAGMFAFDSAQSYTIGGSTISLDGLAGQSAIYVATGSHQIDAPISAVDALTITVAPAGSTLTLTTLQPTNAAITKAGAGTAILNNVRAASLSVNAGRLRVAPTGTTAATSSVSALSIAGMTDAWSATLDLADNAMIVNYTGTSPLATIRNQIKSGSSAMWSGTGITSSIAASVAIDGSNIHKTALGYAEASELGLNNFAGLPIAGNAVVIRYTLAGDANLDGMVNAIDFNAVATKFGSAASNWTTGDFNYDGTINSLDFDLLAVNFNFSQPIPAVLSASLIPEPAAISGVIIALSCLLRRRVRCGGC